MVEWRDSPVPDRIIFAVLAATWLAVFLGVIFGAPDWLDDLRAGFPGGPWWDAAFIVGFGCMAIAGLGGVLVLDHASHTHQRRAIGLALFLVFFPVGIATLLIGLP